MKNIDLGETKRPASDTGLQQLYSKVKIRVKKTKKKPVSSHLKYNLLWFEGFW